MQLYTDSDAPTLDLGVEMRLKRLDPDLKVTFSKWSIHPITSQPLIGKDGKPIPDPLFHLWRWDRDEQKYYYVAWYKQFTHAEVRFLESDPLRRMSPEQYLAHNRRLAADEEAKKKLDFAELRKDVAEANRTRMNDLLFEDKVGIRDAKITSYPGQENRGTPGQVSMDDKEAGWEMPEEA